jgi:hypothetical protein
MNRCKICLETKEYHQDSGTPGEFEPCKDGCVLAERHEECMVITAEDLTDRNPH